MRSSRPHKLGGREQLARISPSLRRGSQHRGSLVGGRRGWAALCVVLVVSLASAGLSVSPVSAQAADGPSARVWAKKLASGNVEFGVAVYAAGSSSGANVAVTNRYFPYASAAGNIGTWYNSEAVVLRSGSDSTLASIRARRLASGNLEFALRVYGIEDQVWTPRARYFVYVPAVEGRTAYSSPLYFRQHNRECLDGAVPNAARNLGLFRDCEVLVSAIGPLEGTTSILSQLNSWTRRDQLPWSGITLKDDRVSEFYIGPTGFEIPSERSQQSIIDGKPLGDLDGIIPGILGSLSALEKLWISLTGTQGVIPSELGNLSNLKELRFNNLGLVGPIPPELGNLESLEKLTMVDLKWVDKQHCRTRPTDCGLPDPVPPEVRSLMEDTSGLGGAIPSELGNLTNLKELYLESNLLRQSIPSELGNLENLEILSLQVNWLTGAIPSELGNLTNLKELHLNSNSLTGAIPPELGNLSNLESLAISWNKLSGTIPAELGKLAPSEGGSIQRISFRGRPSPPRRGLFGGAWVAEGRVNNPDLTGCIPASLNHPNIYVERGSDDAELPFCSS